MRTSPSNILGFGFCLSFFLIPLTGFSQAPAADATVAAEPVQYVLEDIQGSNVQVLETGTDQWAAGEEGEVLESGDEIKVGDGSEATLTLQADTSVHLDAGTDLTVAQIDDNHQGGFLSRLKITAGRILADVRKNLQDSQSSFEVDANGVICGVRGTAFEVEANGDDVQTLTHEGTVEVKNGSQDNLVHEGNAFSFRHGRFMAQRLLDRDEIGRFQKWRAFRAHVFEKRRLRFENIHKGLRRAWVRRALRRHHRRQEFLNRR
jgi:hypothetical protein